MTEAPGTDDTQGHGDPRDGGMTILYEHWEQYADRLAAVLEGPVTVVRDPHELQDAVAAHPEEVLVVFGPSTALSEAVAFAQRCRTHRPATGVVLVRQHLDARVTAEAVRAGLYDVVAATDHETLTAVCARVIEAGKRALGGPPDAAQQPPEGKVIAVFSGKGGTGTSMVASNLAVALATDGGRRVCLLDLDLAFGDLALMLDLPPERTIMSAVPVADRIDETGLRTMLVRHRSGVEVLLAPIQPADAERVSRDLVAEIIYLARSMFDHVVLDCASHLNDQTLAALDAAHYHVLVTTPELPALKSLRVTLDTFDLLEYARDRRIVVLNRSDSKVGLSMSDVERAVRMPVAAHIPSHRDVPASVNRGVPIVLDQPQHPVSVAIRELAASRFLQTRRPLPRHRRGLMALLTESRKG